MATKRNAAPKKPPQTVSEVLLAEVIKDINSQTCVDYATLVMGPRDAKMSDKQRKAQTEAVMRFANLGWTYYHAQNSDR